MKSAVEAAAETEAVPVMAAAALKSPEPVISGILVRA